MYLFYTTQSPIHMEMVKGNLIQNS